MKIANSLMLIYSTKPAFFKRKFCGLHDRLLPKDLKHAIALNATGWEPLASPDQKRHQR
jgi:hypothetical protein